MMNLVEKIEVALSLVRNDAELVGVVQVENGQAVVLVKSGNEYITWRYNGGHFHTGVYGLDSNTGLKSLADRAFTSLVW